MVFLRGDESEVESNGGCGETPARCVIVVATARQLARGPDSVVSLCQVKGGFERHYSGESRMVVAFSVRCSLLLSVPCQDRATPGGFRQINERECWWVPPWRVEWGNHLS